MAGRSIRLTFRATLPGCREGKIVLLCKMSLPRQRRGPKVDRRQPLCIRYHIAWQRSRPISPCQGTASRRPFLLSARNRGDGAMHKNKPSGGRFNRRDEAVYEPVRQIAARCVHRQPATGCDQVFIADYFGDVFISAEPVVDQRGHALRAEILVQLHHVDVRRGQPRPVVELVPDRSETGCPARPRAA